MSSTSTPLQTKSLKQPRYLRLFRSRHPAVQHKRRTPTTLPLTGLLLATRSCLEFGKRRFTPLANVCSIIFTQFANITRRHCPLLGGDDHLKIYASDTSIFLSFLHVHPRICRYHRVQFVPGYRYPDCRQPMSLALLQPAVGSNSAGSESVCTG